MTLSKLPLNLYLLQGSSATSWEGWVPEGMGVRGHVWPPGILPLAALAESRGVSEVGEGAARRAPALPDSGHLVPPAVPGSLRGHITQPIGAAVAFVPPMGTCICSWGSDWSLCALGAWAY